MLAFAALLLLALFAVSLFIGKFPLSLSAILSGNELQRKVLVSLRLSRTAVAVIGGTAMGAAGFAYQTVFRNPLASPDVAGVSSGAGAGAAAGILLFRSASAVAASAFAGAILAVVAVLGISALDREGKNGTIVLAGIAVHSVAQTILMCLKLAADPEKELASVEYWLMGGLGGVSYRAAVPGLILCLVGLSAMFALHRQTLLLSLDEGEAATLGVNVKQMRFAVLFAATLSVSAVVSITGIVSFVGLIAPHGARLLLKNNSRGVMVLSGIFGAVLLTAADILARSAAETELPVSIFTSLIGAPVLVALALRKERGI